MTNNGIITIFIVFGMTILAYFGLATIIDEAGMINEPANNTLIAKPILSSGEQDLQTDAAEPSVSREESVVVEGESTQNTSESENIPTETEIVLADTVTIDKFNTTLPLITSQTSDSSKLYALLDQGVVLFPQSAGFGMEGQTVIMGHSAPANWPNIKHDTAFSRINELVAGDRINIVYKGVKYDYSVTRMQIISKGSNLSGAPAADSSLVLVTCWPPGRDAQRIAVEAIPAEIQ